MKKRIKAITLIGLPLTAIGVSSIALTDFSDKSQSTSMVNTDITDSVGNELNTTSRGLLDFEVLSSSRTTSTTSDEGIDYGSKSLTPKYTPGNVERTLTDGTKATRYLSDQYYNNRIYMPILDSVDHQYANERTGTEIQRNTYPGWKTGVKTNFEGNVSVTTNTYKPSDELLVEYPTVDTEITTVDFWLGGTTFTVEDVNKILEQNSFDFVIISGIDSSTPIKDLKIPEGVKKLTLKAKDYNFQWNEEISISDLKIPSTVQEFEMYLGSAVKSIDPLTLPENMNIISDVGLASGMSSTFKEIKIVDATLTNGSEKLQKAINDVYIRRIGERAFQGVSAGGYIGSWDLSKTKVTSFNDVIVPPLNDGTGRFYIGHVEVTTTVSGTTQTEIISSNSPSNDSMIDSWYDHGGGLQQIQEVIVKSTIDVSVETATQEIMGFVAKYPNVAKIDVTGIKLSNGTQQELVEKVKAQILTKYGEDSKLTKIEFVINGFTIN